MAAHLLRRATLSNEQVGQRVGDPAAFGGAPHGRLEATAWLEGGLSGDATPGIKEPVVGASIGSGIGPLLTEVGNSVRLYVQEE